MRRNVIDAPVVTERLEDRLAFDAQPYSPLVPANYQYPYTSEAITVGNKIYFQATNAVGGIGFTSGSAVDTGLVPGSFVNPNGPLRLTAVNSTVYFVAAEPGVAGQPEAIYRVRANDAGLLKLSSYFQRVGNLTAFNDKLYFFAYSNSGVLYESDGTVAGTKPASFFTFPQSSVHYCQVIDGKLYLAGFSPGGTSIYVSDGTTAGTTLIATVPSISTLPNALRKTANGITFMVGKELWVTDSTPAGTLKLATLGDFYAYRKSASTGEFAVFVDSDSQDGPIWRTDGTVAGTMKLSVVHQDYDSGRLIASGSSIFVSASNGLAKIGRDSVTIDDRVAGRHLIGANGLVYFGGNASALTAINLGRASDVSFPDDTFMYADGSLVNPLGILQNSVISFSQSGLFATPLDAPALPGFSGRIFNDVNANGVFDIGEPIFTRTVKGFIDLNNNGVQDSPSTESQFTIESDGTFNVPWTRLGDYSISFSGSLSSYQVATTQTRWPVSVTPGGTLSPILVGYHNRNTRSGKVINDLNANDVANTGEPGAVGVTVYADVNENNELDTGEVTAITDASGNWTMIDVPLGTYAIRIVVPPSWYGTFPYSEEFSTTGTVDGGVATIGTFGVSQSPPRNLISGRIFEDTNGDGVYTASDFSYGGTVWNDLDLNGSLDAGEPSAVTTTGAFSLYSTPGVQHIRVNPALADWTAAPSAASFVLNPGERLFNYAMPIVIAPRQGNTVSGTLFRDSNLNGFRDGNEAQLVRLVGLDINGDGFIAATEPVRQANSTGHFLFNNVPAGTYGLKIILTSLLFQPSAPLYGGSYPIVVTEGSAIDGMELGGETLNAIVASPHAVPIRVFHDLNRNGVQDAGEPLHVSPSTFIDLNGNGVKDSYFTLPSEPAYGGIPLSLATNTYRFVTEVPTGWILVNGDGPVYRQFLLTESMTLNMALYRPRATASVFFDPNTRTLELNFSTAQVAGQPVQGVRILDAQGQTVANISALSTSTVQRRYRLPTTLPDGHYFVEVGGDILAAFDEDPALVPDQMLSFRMLRGDADNSGHVDFSDLLILAQNYGLTGRSFSQGNFNYDASGRVDFDDLLLLAQNYSIGPSLRRSALAQRNLVRVVDALASERQDAIL